MKYPRWFVKTYIIYRSSTSLDQLRSQTLKQLEAYEKSLETLPPERLESKKTSDGWNGMQIIYHTLNGAKSMMRIADGLRQNQEVPNLERSAVGKTKDLSQTDLLEYCRRVKAQASQFEYQGQSSRTCSHPFAGELNWKQWLAMNVVHMERHYQQLLRTLG
jgi:hypothetical protein